MNQLKLILIVGLGISIGAAMNVAGSRRERPWDWVGIVGTGQSLSVGGTGLPIRTGIQTFGNLKFDSKDLAWPIDPNDPKLALAPLTEPVGRRSPGYPSAWPENIDGETYHTSAADEISSLVQDRFNQSYITVHEEVGESGQGMVRIRKNSIHQGLTGRSYEAAMIQTKAIARLAHEAGKTYGVGAIFMTHGETDTGNKDYESELAQLWSDYNHDLKAITGQKQDVTMIVSQHNRLGERSPSTIAQWKVGDDYPKTIVCSGPKYQYPYALDALHLTAEGYRQLGEKYGEVYFERVVLGHPWKPLEPIWVTHQKQTITIHFHVPKGPLVWDTTLGEPHPTSKEWANGKGFEVTDSAGKFVRIRFAVLKGRDQVVLELETDPGPHARLSYAMYGEPSMQKPPFNASPHWGSLRDSDPFVGSTTQTPQPNYCVAFELPLP